MEVRKTTDLELLQFFVSGTEGVFVGEELKLKFTGADRKIYYKNVVAATLEHEGKVLTANIKQNFLFFPELDNLLRELGFFRLVTSCSIFAIYSSYIPKNYRAQYTIPSVLWKAWILCSNEKEKLLLLHGEEWLTIENLSFSGSHYLVSFVGIEKPVEIQQTSNILWGDRKPVSAIRIWSSTTKSYTTVPIFRPQQIPSILEIEKDSMIATEDFWRVVRVFHDKLETSDSKLSKLLTKYDNAKNVFQNLKTELIEWKQKEETLREQIKERDEEIALRDKKITLYKQSIELYQRSIDIHKIAVPTTYNLDDKT